MQEGCTLKKVFKTDYVNFSKYLGKLKNKQYSINFGKQRFLCSSSNVYYCAHFLLRRHRARAMDTVPQECYFGDDSLVSRMSMSLL